MKVFKQLFTVGFVLMSLVSFSQANDYKVRKCFGYQRDSCKVSQNIYYKVHDASRSALFLKGQTSKTVLTIYNGRDYRVSLCWAPVLGNRILFKIIDNETDNVLYDNANDEFSYDFEFTVAQSREIEIQVTIPGSSDLTQATNEDELIFVEKDKEMGCVGVLIEHMITPTKGF
ncbi:MAG: hypothetical protein PF517_20740 [Salinivirgaceae bacterium]|jgi:hypothetical protein|nr:hypothetical protein [Salinivirgaceae bacterium]